jgi:hypothetical protein
MSEVYGIDADWQDWLSDIWDNLDSIASESRLRRAVIISTNDTLKRMRTIITSVKHGLINKVYYVKKEDLTAAMRMNMARQRGRNIRGSLSFRYRQSLPLSLFNAKQGKTYVSVKVLKTSRAGRIRPGGEKKILATRKRRAAVWIARGQIYARVEGREKPLILYGPSFMAFFRSPENEAILAREENAWMLKRLQQNVNFLNRKK